MDKFKQIQNQFQQLRESYQAGFLDKDAFQKAVEDLAFSDENGQTWMLGVASGDWYRLQDGEWIRDDPFPVSSAGTAGTPTPPPPPPVTQSTGSTPPPPPSGSFEEPPPEYDFQDEEHKPTKKKVKKKRRGCLIAAVILVVVLACLGAVFIGYNMISDGDTLYEFETSSRGNNQDTFIDIDNQTSFDICGIYISPTTSDDWGENWLSEGERISSFSLISFPVSSGQTVDIFAEDCQGNTIDILYDISITQEGVTITYSPNP
jgi:hypothetical protein